MTRGQSRRLLHDVGAEQEAATGRGGRRFTPSHATAPRPPPPPPSRTSSAPPPPSHLPERHRPEDARLLLPHIPHQLPERPLPRIVLDHLDAVDDLVHVPHTLLGPLEDAATQSAKLGRQDAWGGEEGGGEEAGLLGRQDTGGEGGR